MRGIHTAELQLWSRVVSEVKVVGLCVFKLISVIVQTLCLCLLNQTGVSSSDTSLGESCRHL